MAVQQRAMGNQAMQRLLRSDGVHAKLKVSQPGDRYEREADRVANALVATPEPVGQPVQLGTASAVPSGGPTHPAADTAAGALRDRGRPLSSADRAFFEPRLGYRLSEVRIHTGPRAADSTRELAARAYAVGDDIVFGPGQYSLAGSAGRALLAHELAHVVQQRRAAAPGAYRQEATGNATASPTAKASAEKPKEGAEALDADIEALDLAPVARKAAYELKRKRPDTVFTSGRRSLADQARAMATNIVASKDRKWITNTYSPTAALGKLQAWVDANAAASTVPALEAGLQGVLEGLTEAERGYISKHLTGQAFDVRPVTKDAEGVKADINALPGKSKFLTSEGGLVVWHVQF